MNRKLVIVAVIITVIALVSTAVWLNRGTRPEKELQVGHADGSKWTSTELIFSIRDMPGGVKTTECLIFWNWNNTFIESEGNRYGLNDSIEASLRFIHDGFLFTANFVDNNTNGIVDRGDFIALISNKSIEAGFYDLVIIYTGSNEDYGKNIIISRLYT